MSFIIDPYRYASCPAEALAFIAAAGITDATQKQAICTLVSDLKIYGIWTKMKAIYPFCGSTSTQQKYNLKDPRDLDAAFRLVFSGGWTFSNNGATPNGINAYGDTKLNQSLNLLPSNNHISIYSRTDTNGSAFPFAYVDSGITNNTTHSFSQILARNLGNAIFENGTNIITVSTSNSLGLYIGSSTSTTSAKLYKNSSLIGSSTTLQATTMFNGNIFLSATNDVNSSIARYYSIREIAFSSIGDGLTDTEAANLYTAVQAYQTTLGRQV